MYEELLNQYTLASTLKSCNDNPRCIGMIAFNTEKRLGEFIRELVRITNPVEVPGIKIIKQCNNSGRVEFFNGSVIYLKQASAITRDDRCHILLYDDELEPRTRYVLNRLLVPYKLSQREKNDRVREFFYKPVETLTLSNINEPDTTELDSFLNEFKIVPRP